LLSQIFFALVELLLTISDDEIALLDCIVAMGSIEIEVRAALEESFLCGAIDMKSNKFVVLIDEYVETCLLSPSDLATRFSRSLSVFFPPLLMVISRARKKCSSSRYIARSAAGRTTEMMEKVVGISSISALF